VTTDALGQPEAELAGPGGGLPARRALGAPQGHVADVGRAEEGDDRHHRLRRRPGLFIGLLDSALQAVFVTLVAKLF